MELKRIESKDINLMKELVVEGFKKYSCNDIENFINTSGNYAFIAKEDNKINALCYGYTLFRPDTSIPFFYLHSFGVVEEYRNKGIGQKLLAFVKDYIFNTLKCSKCFLCTENDNATAKHIYENLGWEYNELAIRYDLNNDAY